MFKCQSYLCCRDPKPIWVQQCAWDQGGPIFRAINANPLSCKKHPHLPALILLRFYIWFLFYTILFTTEIVIWNLNCLRYGNASYVDERHRHRYSSEQNVQICWPYLFPPLLSGSFACISHFEQETCGGLGSFLWSWRFYCRRGEFYLHWPNQFCSSMLEN